MRVRTAIVVASAYGAEFANGTIADAGKRREFNAVAAADRE